MLSLTIFIWSILD